MAQNRQQFTLQFNADTTQAKKDMQNLLKSLNSVGKINLDTLGLSQEIREAASAAQELEAHLKNATNSNTGKLNLIEFNDSIKASGQSMAQLMQTLAMGGAQGQAAFQSMATAIANTQVPIKQTNALLNNMMTTLKNTVKWELSSSVVHGLESAFGNAVSYVKSLNSSLTNIRIVTGATADEMARFAESANRAARELSTTTKAYTDASLIYYQQGDSVEQVAKKAAITIKAANSSFGTTTEEMSEYLTAVWNSYKVGADELERYVDIMAALGAKTATSLEEIATSMQKVAATANTVGVSMEQVSSIISTVSSVTRESAESIGTSFKTIFARIGDLKLGETLDDGVTLGQVSSQLEKIGVAVLDASGGLRDMGDIITDLGNKWQTLASGEKAAIAQVVAGKRQYTQLMALFDNWDMYGENLEIAFDSQGALEQMNKMYEEGVHAAQQRATAALENLYSSLLNDNALIVFAEATAKIADNITNVVDALGGLGGVATTVGGILLRVFSTKIASNLKNIGQSIAAFATNDNYKNQYQQILEDTSNELSMSRSVKDTKALQQTQELLATKQKLLSIEDSLTDKQAEYAQAALSGLSNQIAQLNELEQNYLSTESAVSRLISRMQTFASTEMQKGQGENFEQIFSSYVDGDTGIFNTAKDSSGILGKTVFEQGSMMTTGVSTLAQLDKIMAIGETTLSLDFNINPADTKALEIITQQLKNIQEITKGTRFETIFAEFNEETLKSKAGLQDFKTALEQMTTQSTADFKELSQAMVNSIQQIKDPALKQTLADMFTEFLAESGASADALQRFWAQLGLTDSAAKKLDKTLDNMDTKFNKITTGATEALGAMTSLVSGKEMLSSVSEDFFSNTEDFKLSDNLMSVLGGLTQILSVLPTIIKLVKVLGTALGAGARAAKAGPYVAVIVAILSIVHSIIEGKKEAEEAKIAETLAKEAEEGQKALDKIMQQDKQIETLTADYNSLKESMDIDYASYADSVLALTSELTQQDQTIQGLIATYGSLENAVLQGRRTYLQGVITEGQEAEKAQMADLDHSSDAVFVGSDNSVYVSPYGDMHSSDYADTRNQVGTIITDYQQNTGVESWRQTLSSLSHMTYNTSMQWPAQLAEVPDLYQMQTEESLTVTPEEWWTNLLAEASDEVTQLIVDGIIPPEDAATAYGNTVASKVYEDLGPGRATAEIIEAYGDQVFRWFGNTDYNQVSDLFTGSTIEVTPDGYGIKSDDNYNAFLDAYDAFSAGDSSVAYPETWYGDLFSHLNPERLVINTDAENIVDDLPDDLVLIWKAFEGFGLTMEEMAYLVENREALTEQYPELMNLEAVVDWFDRMATAKTSDEKTIVDIAGSESESHTVLTDAELEMAMLDKYGQEALTLDTTNSQNYFDFLTNMANDLIAQGVPAFEAMEKAMTFLGNWGITSEFSDDYKNLISIGQSILKTNPDANPIQVMSKLMEMWTSYGEDFQYLNFMGAEVADSGDIILKSVALEQETAARTKMSQVTRAKEELSYLTNLGEMSPEELATMTSAQYKQFSTGIDWTRTVEGFEGIDSIEDWAALTQERRAEYLKAVQNMVETDLYSTQGYLAQAGEAYAAWATELDAYYKRQMEDPDSEYNKAVNQNAILNPVLSLFDGSLDYDWANLTDANRQTLNDQYTSVLTNAGIDLTNTTAADYIAGYYTNSNSAARGWVSSNSLTAAQNQTTIDFVNSILSQIPALQRTQESFSHEASIWQLFGGEEEEYLSQAEKNIMALERQADKVNTLTNAMSEFQSTGKLSKSTKSALEMLGIDPDSLTSVDDFIDQIESVQNELQDKSLADITGLNQSLIDQIIDPTTGATKSFDELADGTISQEDYERLVQAYQQKQAILNIDTQELKLQYQQAEATKAINEAIELQRQTVEKLTKEASKMTAAYDALSNSIGESALSFEAITKATQAGLDVSNWSSDISTQLDIISEAAYKAYEAEVKVLEAQKLNVEGVKNLTRNRTNYAKLVNDMLSKDTFDSGELDKFINDYFGQFDGATQEAVRSYISSLEAAGQSFTWEGLIEHLTAENLMTQNEIDLLRANLKDGLTGMLDEAIAEHQAAAQEVADAWVTAFDAIMKAKEGLADGKSIAESLMGDTESQAALLSQYFQNNPNATNEEAVAWLRNRNLSQNAPEFTPDSWSLSNWSQARGMFSVANRYASQEGTNREFARTVGTWENWVNDRFRDTWNQMDATTRQEAGVETYEQYVAQAWTEFLNGRSKEEAYWDERAAMVVAEADANQQWMNSQVQTAQTTYQNTVESAQNQKNAWQQIYDAQWQVLADETDELTLEDVLDDNLYSLLNTINEGREGEDRYTLDDLTSMTLSDIATQVNAQTASISAAEVQLGKDLAAGTDLDGNTVDLSNTAAGEEALTEAHATSVAAQDNQIDAEELDADILESYGNATGMTTNEFQAYAEHLNSMIDAQHRFDTATEEGKKALYDYAKAVAKAADGFEDLQSITEDTWKTLKDGSKKGSKEWIKGIESLRKTTSKVFGTDMKYITGTFVENHLDELEKMANGTEEEALRAQDAIQDDLVAEILKMEGIEATATVNIDGEQQVINVLDTLQTQFDEWDGKDIGFTITPDIEPALASMGQLLASGTMTAEQITAALNSIGWQPNIQYMEHEVTEQDKSQGYASTTILGKTYTTTISEDVEVGSIVKIPYIASASKMTPPGGGARPSGGGGGGGGGKPKKIDKKDSEDHKERYHPVEQQLERVSDALEKVDKMKRRAFGESHIKAMESEIGLLKDEIKLQEEYLRQAKEYLALDAQRVASLGGIFDSQGNIANYDELIDSIVAKYNAFVDKYNAASASKQESMEEEKEEMDEWFEDAMEWISQYEETLALVYDKENELLELQNQISEKTLEKIQYKIEYKVEFNQSELDFLEYINDAYDETLEKQDLIMDNYVRQGQIAEQNLSYLATAKKELEAAYASGDLTSADYVEGLQDIQDQTLENLEAIQDVKESIDELYGDTLDLAGEQLDKHTAKIDSATEAMKSYMSILQLMGKGTNYEDLLYFYDKQYDYNVASLEAQVNYLNVLKEEEQYYLDRMNTAEGLTETEREQYEALIETLNDANSTMLSSTEETLQNIKEMYDTTIENIMRKLEQSMTGMDKDLAWLTEEYGFYTEEMEQYVSASRELYEVSKLNRNIQNSINDTTSKVHKQKLKELQDEINAQSELKELSEYEIEMLNLKYELLLKQIALEEAQNAKSTVRLTRDSEGNMIYQYTADQDAINQAQQEYEDVLQQMSDLNYETENNIYSQTLQLRQETLESIKEIAQDETLTEEQKQARIAEIMEHYYNQAEYLQEQYGIVMENTTTTNKLIAEHYGVAVETLSKNTQESISAILSEMINNSDNYKTEMQMAYEEIKEAMQSYSEKIAEVTQITNTSYGDMIDSVKTYDEITNDANKETADLTSELKKQVNQLHDSTSAWDTYYKKIQNVTKEYGDMYSAIQKAIAAQGQLANASAPSSVKTNTSVKKTTDKTPTPSSSSGGSGSGGNGGSGGNSGSKTLTNQTTISGGGGRDGLLSMGSRPSSNVCYTRYATGGLADYTGPAWVDGTAQSPELVLNSSDTQNMLNIVDTVRRLDKTTLSMMDEFINLATSSMMSNLFQIHAGSANGNNQTELEQNVHITAEFPNVQDSNEIQDAFDNLVNRAAQYIGSKKK